MACPAVRGTRTLPLAPLCPRPTHAPCDLKSLYRLPARAAARPWLRAYLPSLQPPQGYNPLTNTVSGDDDGDEDEDGRTLHTGSRGQQRRPAAAGGGLRGEHLFRPPGGVVRMLGLVAVRAVCDGEELLQVWGCRAVGALQKLMEPRVIRK